MQQSSFRQDDSWQVDTFNFFAVFDVFPAQYCDAMLSGYLGADIRSKESGALITSFWKIRYVDFLGASGKFWKRISAIVGQLCITCSN